MARGCLLQDALAFAAGPMALAALLGVTLCGCPPFEFAIVDEQAQVVFGIDHGGNVFPTGPIVEEVEPESEDLSQHPDVPEFLVKNVGGTIVARVDSTTGAVYLMGRFSREPELEASAAAELLFVDGAGTVQALIDEDGNLKYRGQAAMAMRRAVSSDTYNPCGTLDVTVTLHYHQPSAITAMGVQEILPPGWTYAELLDASTEPAITPSVGAAALDFGWISIPEFPLSITYRVHVPGAAYGEQTLMGSALYRTDGPERRSPIITTTLGEGPALEGECDEGESGGDGLRGEEGEPFFGDSGEGEGEGEGDPCSNIYHSADQNQDNRISLSELLRVIQFYNAGGYHCATEPGSTEDGYVPGPGFNHDCCPHDSDYNLQNWNINLSELLRLIQFYSFGGYTPAYCLTDELGSEDDFLPVNLGAHVAVESIIIADSSPTVHNVVNYLVTFTTDVEGVDETDFRVCRHPCGGMDTQALEVIFVNERSYQVKAQFNAGCECRLVLVDDNSITSKYEPKHALGGPMLGDGTFTRGEVYTFVATSVITLMGDNVIVRECSEGVYVDEGACACDPTEGILTVTVARSCDTGEETAPRAYKMIYNATNSLGTTVTATRYVIECNDKIEFADAELERLIRSEARLVEPDIYPVNVMRITHLFAQDNQQGREAGIARLSGLEYCLDLEELYLFNELPNSYRSRWNLPTDLSPLSTLQSLKRLDLTNTEIDSDTLASVNWSNLHNLKWLKLNQNKITSIAPLADIVWLEVLHLEGNDISTYEEAKESLSEIPWNLFVNLKHLNLAFNFLHTADIAPLANIGSGVTFSDPPAILWLDLHSNEITNIGALAGLTSLTHLNLHENHISDLTPLHELAQIRCLWLGRNPIADITPLTLCSGLGEGEEDRLSLRGCWNLDSPEAEAAMATLENKGVFVWRPEYIETAAQKASLPDYIGRILLHYDSGVVTLSGHDLIPGVIPGPRSVTGEHGRLLVLDQNGLEVVAPVSFVLTEDPCELGDELGTGELEEAELWVLVPLSGPIDLIEYLPVSGNPETLYDTRGQQKQADAPAYSEQPGIPIPIYARLIHGELARTDARAFVLLVFGEAFTTEQLGVRVLMLIFQCPKSRRKQYIISVFQPRMFSGSCSILHL